ncbi:MAG: efflux RND transporter permease subunit [Deltaproteobacteria bacterium]|nr:efflux RND transporter permease subunit [Deltaproteobacteria bacterium]
MSLPEICIRRPVFATMLVVSLVVLGLASFRTLGVDIYPKVDFPTVTVTTRLEGASPEEIESQITKRVEEAINTISGLDELRSTTIEGQSQIYASFVLEKDIETAANEVREKVSTVLRDFPPGTDPPVIERFDPDASPIMAIVVSCARVSREVTEIADKKIKRQLETIKDIGAVSLVGARKRELQIYVDPDRLTAYNLSIQQVKEAIRKQNAEIPGGRLTWETREEGLRTLGRIEVASGFNEIIVADVKGAPVRVKDIGYAIDGEEEARTLSRLDGENAVSLLIRKQSGANTVEVVDRITARLEEIQKTLPQDIRFQVVRDQSRFIRRSMEEVEEHLILGGFLAALVVLFFIRNWRSALITAISIPASIIATFTFLRYMGFTLNNMTMLGISLSTGIVIDDAIIVLENIFRHMEEEKRSPMEAALEGTREIALAVLATTLSLVVIFLPVAFMGAIVGRFFRSFGLTMAFAILVSLVIAFTLVPMLCSRFLKVTSHHQGARETRFYAMLERGYEWLLAWCLRHRVMTLLVAVGIFASLRWLLPITKVEVFQDDDMSEFEVIVEAPPGSSLERSDTILRHIEADLRTVPEIEHLFTTIGVRGQYQSNVTDASIYIGLTHLSQRERSQQEMMQVVRELLKKYPDLRLSVQNLNLMQGGGFRQTPFNMTLRGPELPVLDQYSQALIQTLATIPGFVDVDTGQALRHPEVQVHIDRKKASDLGVRVEDIASALRTQVGGERISFYREAGEQYNVRLRLQPSARKNEAAVAELMVPSRDGKLVRLSNVTTLHAGKGPAQIDRYSQERQVTVIANLHNKPMGEAMLQGNAAVKELNLGPEYSTAYSGRGKIMIEAMQNFAIAFVLSIVFIYIVLAAQFESFIHPVTIMVSMFLSLPFGILSLVVTDQPLSIYSVLGVFLLMGVVKKNAILQVDYTNHLRAQGMARYEAQIVADRVRLRPILMTTLTIIAGMLPIALGKGDGASARAALATVVVGGQALCLFVTLLVTPVVYSFFDDMRGLSVGSFAPGRVWRWVRTRAAATTSTVLIACNVFTK